MKCCLVSIIHYYYYFTVENGKQPTFDDYYSPEVTITIENYSGNDYRVKYEFTGAINPGDIYPSGIGNVIGLHYSDWSLWNKENDFSKSFGTYVSFQNANIPVYTNDGVRLFGIDPLSPDTGDTIIIPDPVVNDVVFPAYTFPAGNYAVFGLDAVSISDRDTIKNGKIGSNSYIEIGCRTLIAGDIISGGDLFCGNMQQ